MHAKSIITLLIVTLVLTYAPVGAQNSILVKPTSDQSREKTYKRTAGPLKLDESAAFARIHPEQAPQAARSRTSVTRPSVHTNRLSSKPKPELSFTTQSVGTGGGDIDEVEPNDNTAQGVSLPVNVFGEISLLDDVDFFSFQAFANQEIVVEAFAARFAGSDLIADIGLFTVGGTLISESVGDEFTDPPIRFTPTSDQVLIVGITDADGLGGLTFDYLLNLTRGQDIDEVEPNGNTAQVLPALPVTIFGNMDSRDDVDFYSFQGIAGQTLIIDVDADVLGSRLDAEVNLSDPATGKEFFFNDQSEGADPRFNIVLPFTGTFVVGIDAFAANSRGFYRMNLSLVSGSGAPLITSINRISTKKIEVSGTGFTTGSVVELAGDARSTTVVSSTLLRAKVKNKPGKVITVANPPDDRRSNPLILQ